MNKFPREIHVFLFCQELPSFDEPAIVGIQVKNQCVLEGVRKRDGSFEFKFAIQVRNKEGDSIDFFGLLVHGTPATRFIYLSCKRTIESATPWIHRVKIPLALKITDLGDATGMRADITGRRPHAAASMN